jgi:hypothetical protein
MTRAVPAVVLVLALALGCSKAPNAPPTGDPNVQTTNGRITITDISGKEWDITHAVNVYGFDPEDFEFGTGTDAFPAVFDPHYVGPGESGYPHENATRMVMGATFFGDARSYSLAAMARREVINDVWGGDTYLAVAY